MIELISQTRCIECNLCVKVCPTNVFDEVRDGVPVIARQEDCQTCYQCEIHCPVDAMFVAPESEVSVSVDEDELIASGLLGSYRKEIGWGKGRERGSRLDTTYLVMGRFRG